MNRTAGHKRGFSLVEVIVSFAILALSLTVLFRAISDGASNLKYVDDKNMAISMARSKIAEVGYSIPLTSEQTEGQEKNGYSWIVKIKPYVKTASARNKAYWVQVIITDKNGKQTSLKTIKLETKP